MVVLAGRLTRAHLAVVIALVALVAGAPAMAVRADDLGNAQGRQNQLSQDIQGKKQQVQQLQGQEARAMAQLNALQTEVAAAESALARENGRLDHVLGQIDATQRDLVARRVEEARRKDILEHRTRSLYKQGGDQSFITAVFSSTNFGDLLDRYIVMRDITHSDQLLVQQIGQDRRAIEALAAHLEQQRAEQKLVVDGIQQRRNALNGQYVQEAALRQQLHIQEVSLSAQVADAQRALAQVNAEISALVEARKRAHSSGILAWPGVQGPLTQPFGCTDFRGEPPPPSPYTCPPSRPYFHTGIDIAGPYGSEVTAADGGIAYTYPGSGGYGNHVIMVHANGMTTLYGHLASFAVASGTSVAKGQRIGYEGSTGFSSGPHLHFEVRLNDSAVDPCRYVGC
ncbi:MAG: murein hydrolase activator EnvC family protein [Candidatus Dormibacteria bacterium]